MILNDMKIIQNSRYVKRYTSRYMKFIGSGTDSTLKGLHSSHYNEIIKKMKDRI